MVVIQIDAQRFLGAGQFKHAIQGRHSGAHDEDGDAPRHGAPRHVLSAAVRHLESLPEARDRERAVFCAAVPVPRLGEEPVVLAQGVHARSVTGADDEEDDERHYDEAQDELFRRDDVRAFQPVENDAVHDGDREGEPGIIDGAHVIQSEFVNVFFLEGVAGGDEHG